MATSLITTMPGTLTLLLQTRSNSALQAHTNRKLITGYNSVLQISDEIHGAVQRQEDFAVFPLIFFYILGLSHNSKILKQALNNKNVIVSASII